MKSFFFMFLFTVSLLAPVLAQTLTDVLFDSDTEMSAWEEENCSSEAKEAAQEGSRLMQENRCSDAIPFFEKAQAIDSRCYFVYLGLGGSYSCNGQHDEAIKVYEKAVQTLSPENTLYFYNLIATEYMAMEKYDSAIASCNKAAQLDPLEGQPYILLGTIYLKKGDLKKAETNLQKAADIARKAEDDITLYQAETLLKQIQR